MSVRNVRVSWFCVRPTSKRWCLKIVQVTMKQSRALSLVREVALVTESPERQSRFTVISVTNSICLA